MVARNICFIDVLFGEGLNNNFPKTTVYCVFSGELLQNDNGVAKY